MCLLLFVLEISGMFLNCSYEISLCFVVVVIFFYVGTSCMNFSLSITVIVLHKLGILCISFLLTFRREGFQGCFSPELEIGSGATEREDWRIVNLVFHPIMTWFFTLLWVSRGFFIEWEKRG